MYHGHTFYPCGVALGFIVFNLTIFSIHCRFVVQVDASERLRAKTNDSPERRGFGKLPVVVRSMSILRTCWEPGVGEY